MVEEDVAVADDREDVGLLVRIGRWNGAGMTGCQGGTCRLGMSRSAIALSAVRSSMPEISYTSAGSMPSPRISSWRVRCGIVRSISSRTTLPKRRLRSSSSIA